MTSADRIFPGTDTTSAAHRDADWAATPLGVVEDWPIELTMAIRTALPSGAAVLLWWGEDLVQIFNHPYTQLIGDKFPAAVGQRGEECWAEAWATLQEWADEARSGNVVYRERERLVIDRYGYDEETFFTFSCSPIFGADDATVLGVLATTTEVTREVFALSRMSVLRDLGGVVAVTDGVASVCRSAVERLTTAAEFPYAAIHVRRGSDIQPVASFGDSAPVDAELETIERVTATGEPEAFVHEGRMVLPLTTRSTESIGALVVTIDPLHQLDDQYRMFLELVAERISRTLTDAYLYAEERHRAAVLAELDTAKTRFIENISHEFRTPLTLLLGPIDDLLTHHSSDLPARQTDSLESARRAALRLQRLVDTLLDVARGDSDGMTLHPEPTDICALTAECAEMFRDATDRAHLQLTVDCEVVTERYIEMDRAMWTHVVMNLLSNAVKFTTEGTVSLTLADAPGAMVLTVSDTGPGIDVADRGRVFERFYQVPETPGRSQEGTGIGLSLVADLVEALGGTISVADNDPVGTRFEVTVPVVSSTQPSGTAVPEVAASLAAPYLGEADTWRPVLEYASEPGSDQRQVLLIEDNADMRDYVTGLFVEQGWHVDVTGTVDDALIRARTRTPDIIVSDIMLPGRNGLSLVEEARGDSRLVRVPIVLLSARAGSESVVQGLRIGADDYVTKPFHPAELVARVRVHLELARLREDLLVDAERESTSLRTALDSRGVLSQAVGLVMATQGIDPDAAFAYIAKKSQDANVKARVVAAQLVDDFVKTIATDES